MYSRRIEASIGQSLIPSIDPFDPGLLKTTRTRPDTAQHMNQACEAVQHDSWFRKQ
jgi:hypothetical protein